MKIIRSHKNPIIKPTDVKPSMDNLEVIGAFNCGVTEYKNNFLLIIRVAERYHSKDSNIVGVPMYCQETNQIIVKKFNRSQKDIDFSDPRFVKTKDALYLTSISHFRLATSLDGVNFEIDQNPFMVASTYHEAYGIEDPRITFIDDTYYINYSAISRSGVVTCLARTKNFETVERLGIIFLQDNKDVTIFPEKINGSYYALNRPVSAYFNRPEMWIAKSKDLVSYYDHQLLASLRAEHFDSARIGASAVPFKTEIGWIEIYHGADINNRYVAGLLVLDLEDPTKILYRSELPFVEPSANYELEGFMPNVIFPCGHLVKEGLVYLYYGNCDENICLITFGLDDLINYIRLEMKKDET